MPSIVPSSLQNDLLHGKGRNKGIKCVRCIRLREARA